jgi:hypothetical protein
LPYCTYFHLKPRKYCLKIPVKSIIRKIPFSSVGKNMVNEKFCQDCSQGLSCQQRYQQLANLKGPSVTYQVIIAFLLPLLVLLACLAIFDRLLAGTMMKNPLQMALVFMLALSVTIGLILIIKLLGKYFTKNR